MRAIWWLAGTGFLLAASIDSAQAQLRICNQTSSELQIAVGEPQGTGLPFRDRGWFSFSPGECAPLDGGPFKYSSQFYYARYRDRAKTGVWAGDENSVKGCINPEQSFEEVTKGCSPPNKLIAYIKVDTGQATSHTIHLRDDTSLDFSAADVQAKVCEVLNKNLDRPKLRSEKVKLGSYIDALTPPQTTTECTNTYDTGVPNPGSATSVWDECESEQELPFGGWTCVPGWTVRYTNIRACNTWKTEKRWMECDLQFQLKLPNYIEKPLSEFVDNSYEIAEHMRKTAATSLPLQCSPRAAAAGTGENVTQAVANQIVEEIKTAAINATPCVRIVVASSELLDIVGGGVKGRQ
jgi:uncharacterized membrane protein